MNRRSFIGLLGSLPFVGGLFSWGRENEKDRFERLARTGLVKGETFDFRGYGKGLVLALPPNTTVSENKFYGIEMPFCQFKATHNEGMSYITNNLFIGATQWNGRKSFPQMRLETS